jgi:hypothetical protein
MFGLPGSVMTVTSLLVEGIDQRVLRHGDEQRGDDDEEDVDQVDHRQDRVVGLGFVQQLQAHATWLRRASISTSLLGQPAAADVDHPVGDGGGDQRQDHRREGDGQVVGDVGQVAVGQRLERRAHGDHGGDETEHRRHAAGDARHFEVAVGDAGRVRPRSTGNSGGIP